MVCLKVTLSTWMLVCHFSLMEPTIFDIERELAAMCNPLHTLSIHLKCLFLPLTGSEVTANTMEKTPQVWM